MKRYQRIFATALVVAALSFLAAPQVNAQVEFEIVQMDLTGGGSLPLAFLPGSPTDNYGFVDSLVDVRLVAPSTMTITSEPDFSNLPNISVQTTTVLDLFLEFTITDNDPSADFAGTLGPMFTIAPVEPLSTSIVSIVDFSEFNPNDPDPFNNIPVTATITSTTIKSDLGVDVNNNGDLDFIEFTIDDFLLGEDALIFESVVPGDPLSGLIVTAAMLTMTGQVADISTDPPFTIGLSTPIAQQVPEPTFIGIFSLGLLLLGAWRRRAH